MASGARELPVWIRPRLSLLGTSCTLANYVSRQARSHRIPASQSDWRMEPLAAIHNACEDRKRPTIGGCPQMAKVYRHGSARAYGFLDPSRGRDVIVRGTRVDRRAAIELKVGGLLIDLSRWNLVKAAYPGRRAEASRRKGHRLAARSERITSPSVPLFMRRTSRVELRFAREATAEMIGFGEQQRVVWGRERLITAKTATAALACHLRLDVAFARGARRDGIRRPDRHAARHARSDGRGSHLSPLG